MLTYYVPDVLNPSGASWDMVLTNGQVLAIMVGQAPELTAGSSVLLQFAAYDPITQSSQDKPPVYDAETTQWTVCIAFTHANEARPYKWIRIALDALPDETLKLSGGRYGIDELLVDAGLDAPLCQEPPMSPVSSISSISSLSTSSERTTSTCGATQGSACVPLPSGNVTHDMALYQLSMQGAMCAFELALQARPELAPADVLSLYQAHMAHAKNMYVLTLAARCDDSAPPPNAPSCDIASTMASPLTWQAVAAREDTPLTPSKHENPISRLLSV